MTEDKPKHAGGRPKKTTEWRIKTLRENAFQYLEDCMGGRCVTNAARSTLAWKIVMQGKAFSPEGEDGEPPASSDPYADHLKEVAAKEKEMAESETADAAN